MNTNALVTALGGAVLPGFVAMERLVHPDATGEQLVSVIDGDVKHYLRGKIGWGADVLWAVGEFRTALDGAIRQAVNTAAPNSVLPTSPAPTVAVG